VFEDLSRIIAVTGHYGTGKTNFTVNLALDLAGRGERVTVVDLDVVNPYFRSADYGGLLEKHGVAAITPSFANTLLDLPSLPREISGAIEGGGRVIIDLGGDDAGATALGRYRGDIERAGGADMLYLFSAYRPESDSAERLAEHIRLIESASRQKVTRLVNSSNLAAATALSDIEASSELARELELISGVPLAATLALEDIAPKTDGVYPVKRYVRLPWEKQIN